MSSSDLLGLAAGFLVGDAVADSFIDDDSPITKVAVGLVAGSITAKLTKDLADETGVGDVLDDLFDI